MAPRISLSAPYPPALRARRGHSRRVFAFSLATTLRLRAQPRAGPQWHRVSLGIEPVPLTIMAARPCNRRQRPSPRPILRWREGDTLTLAVTNRLSEPLDPLARHPHALADGRRAGPQLPRHRARRDLCLPLSGPSERHLLVPQPFDVSGTDGALRPIVIEPKGGYAQPFDRDYVVMLSDWSSRAPRQSSAT